MTTTARRAVTAIAVLAALVAVLAGCTPKPASHPAGQGRSPVSSAPAPKTTKPFVTWSVLHECGGPRGTFTIYFDAPPHRGGDIAMITYGGGLNRPKTTDTSTMVNVYLRPTRVPQEIGKGPIEIPAVPGWISITGPAVIQPPTHLTISPTTGCPTPHSTQVQPVRRRLTTATHRPAVSHQPVVQPHQHPASPAPVARPVAAVPARPTTAPTPSAMARCEAAIATRPGWVGRVLGYGGSVRCVPSLSPADSDLPAVPAPGAVVYGMTRGADVRVSAQTPGGKFADTAAYEAAHAVAYVELTDWHVITWWDEHVGAKAWWAPNDPNWPALGSERWSRTVATCQGFDPPGLHLPAAPCSLVKQTLDYAHGNPPISIAFQDYLEAVRQIMGPPSSLDQWCTATRVALISCRNQPAGSFLADWPVPPAALVHAGLVPARANYTQKAGGP